MSRQNFVRITTADTKKTYEFPGENNPQLWEVELSIRYVENNGQTPNRCLSPMATVYLERQSLINAGLLPIAYNDQEPKLEEKETVEDLILKLLDRVGVYPIE